MSTQAEMDAVDGEVMQMNFQAFPVSGVKPHDRDVQ